MWGRHREVPDKVSTVVGRGIAIRGSIQGEGSLRVDGQVEGEIHVNGDVYVGEGATVHARIRARHITIAGVVRGNVEAEGRLELTRSGRLYGDLRARVLAIAEGGLFEGRSHVVGAEVPDEEAARGAGSAPAALPEAPPAWPGQEAQA